MSKKQKPISSVGRTRFREKGFRPIVDNAWVTTLSGAPSGNGPVSNGLSPHMDCAFATMADFVTPAYRKISAAGGVVFSPMSSYDYRSSGNVTNEIIRCNGGVNGMPLNWDGALYTVSGVHATSLIGACPGLRVKSGRYYLYPVRGTISDAEIARATAEAQTRAAGFPSDAQLLVMMAEWRKTLQLLPGIVNNFSNILRRINTRNAELERLGTGPTRGGTYGGGLARNLRDLGDGLLDFWLAARFGLRPTVSDAIGALKAVQRQRTAEFVRVTSRGGITLSAPGNSAGNAVHGVGTTPITEQSNDQFTVRAMRLWEARVELLDDLGVNLANVPLALADLTHFSFVLNWMVNVNEYMLALGSLVQPGWTTLGGCTVTSRETSTLYTLGGTNLLPGYPQYTVLTGAVGFVQMVERVKQRVPGVPVGTLSLRAEPFKWVSDFRALDAAALFRQQVKGKGVQYLRTLS